VRIGAATGNVVAAAAAAVTLLLLLLEFLPLMVTVPYMQKTLKRDTTLA
jgi:hypothetical protein